MAEQDTVDQDVAPEEAPAAAAEPAAELVEELRAEVESIDVGAVAQDEDTRLLYRYLRRRSQLALEAQRIRDQVEAVLRDLDNRVRGLDYVLGAQVEQIVRRKLEGARGKSIKTPFGVAGFRTVAARLEVRDEAKLRAAALAEPAFAGFYRTELLLQKSAVNEHFKASGELPPGCELTPAVEKFYVK